MGVKTHSRGKLPVEVRDGFFYADVSTMPVGDVPSGSSAPLVGLLTILLNADWVNIVATVWHLVRRVLTQKAHEGMYEVLEYESTLELLDSKGQKAILHKREKVRFLQDNIIAYQDKAWRVGETFADYKCSPGVAVDHYREGSAFRILISLRGVKNRGDVEEFHIERTIEHGFPARLEYFQTDIDHTTRNFSISVVFPRKRPTKHIVLIERTVNRSTVLGPENIIALPDGRQQAIWRTEKPRLFESYTLQWTW